MFMYAFLIEISYSSTISSFKMQKKHTFQEMAYLFEVAHTPHNLVESCYLASVGPIMFLTNSTVPFPTLSTDAVLFYCIYFRSDNIL